jgi:hypothetical protein
MHIGPLTSISAALQNAIVATVTYQHVADDLLSQAVILDEVCRQMIVSSFQDIDDPTQTLTLELYRMRAPDVYLQARGAFDRVRKYKTELEPEIPLLSDVLSKLDYLAHSMTNIFPIFDNAPRLVGFVHNVERNHISYKAVANHDIRYLLQHYLGLAPDPVFGANVAYTDPRVIETLTPMGFGATVYLNIALHPELVESGRLPDRFEFGRFSRPVAPAPVTVESDGTINLATSS